MHNEKNNVHEKIGYKNPPKQSQFKKGQSGNPKGRPLNKHTDCEDIFRGIILDDANEKITLTMNGKQQSISSFEAVVKSLKSKALSGQVPAVKQYLDLVKLARYEQQKSFEKQMRSIMNLANEVDTLDDQVFLKKHSITKDMAQNLIDVIFERVNNI
jgi:hypothetical protein